MEGDIGGIVIFQNGEREIPLPGEKSSDTPLPASESK